MTEEWRTIKLFPMYQVSNFGNVRSFHKDIVLKKIHHNKGYDIVFLYGELLKNKKCFIHRLVAEHFIPNIDSKPFVNHIDCNKKNNHITNLEWMTEMENTQYYFKMRDTIDDGIPF